MGGIENVIADVRLRPDAAVATIRWAAWFGDRDLKLRFPHAWDVETFSPADGEDMTDAQLEAAFAAPIGTQTISDLAQGRRSPCIVVDDLTRSTPAARLLPLILRELGKAGIQASEVLVLGGVANHRQMTRTDFTKKLGDYVLRHCRVRNHFSWDDCRPVGTTTHGTPIAINAEFLDSDLRILVGSIVPHKVAGFSGGAKLLVPGVASVETARAWHGPHGPAPALAVACPPARADIEEAARMVGVDCIVNVVPNSRRGIAGLVVGDVVEAHRRGVEIARRTFSTPTPPGFDVCVLSGYPKDNEFLQHMQAYHVWSTAPDPIAHEEGSVVVATAATEGAGFHSLAGPRMRLAAGPNLREKVAPRNLIFFAPGINRKDLPSTSDDRVQLTTRWRDTIELLKKLHGSHARVAVFPCGAIQLSEAVCVPGELAVGVR